MKKICCIILALCVILGFAGNTSLAADVDSPLFMGEVIQEQIYFEVDGHVFALGYDTVQDMLDAGIVFDEEDIATAPPVLHKYESKSFKLELEDGQYVRIYVANNSEEDKELFSCKLSRLYYPVDLESSQEALKLNFPLTITEKELVANAGEPTEITHEADVTCYKYISHDEECFYKYNFDFKAGKLCCVAFDACDKQ